MSEKSVEDILNSIEGIASDDAIKKDLEEEATFTAQQEEGDTFEEFERKERLAREKAGLEPPDTATLLQKVQQMQKTKKKRRSTKGTVHDWASLRFEFILSNFPTLTKFFNEKGIPKGTWYPRTTGWVPERAKHKRDMDQKIMQKYEGTALLDTERQREGLADVLHGVIMQWHRLNTRLIDVEDQLLERKPSAALLRELRISFIATTKLLPDLIKTQELLSGRATARSETRNRTIEQMVDLAKNAESKLDRFEKIHGVSLRLDIPEQEEQRDGSDAKQADCTVGDVEEAVVVRGDAEETGP